MGRGQFSRADSSGQDARKHVRTLREFQRRQEGRFHRKTRQLAWLWSGVWQLLACWRAEGVLRAAT